MNEEKHRDPLAEKLRDLPVLRASPGLDKRIMRRWRAHGEAQNHKYRVLPLLAAALVMAWLGLNWSGGPQERVPSSLGSIQLEVERLRLELAAVSDLIEGNTAVIAIEDTPGFDILLSRVDGDPNAPLHCFYREKDEHK